MLLKYDLDAAAVVLDKERPYKKFAGCVRQYRGYASAVTDLNKARLNLLLMADEGITEKFSSAVTQDNDEAQIRGSLATNALITYCRATQTSSRHRVNPEIRTKYSDRLRDNHDEVMRVRNEAIAHFGTGDFIPEFPWNTDRTVVSFSDSGEPSIEHHWSRSNYHQNITNNLYELIDEACSLAKQARDEKKQELIDEIGRLALEDTTFVPRLMTFEFEASIRGRVLIDGDAIYPVPNRE